MTEYEWKLRRRDRRVLTVLLTGAGNLGGFTVWQLSGAGYRSGVVLARLRHCGLVRLTPEHLPPGTGRPPRQFYRLTTEGRAWAMKALGLEER